MSERKGAFLLGLILFFALFLIPFLALTGGAKAKETPSGGSSGGPAAASGSQFRILDSKTGKILTVDARSCAAP